MAGAAERSNYQPSYGEAGRGRLEGKDQKLRFGRTESETPISPSSVDIKVTAHLYVCDTRACSSGDRSGLEIMFGSQVGGTEAPRLAELNKGG